MTERESPFLIPDLLVSELVARCCLLQTGLAIVRVMGERAHRKSSSSRLSSSCRPLLRNLPRLYHLDSTTLLPRRIYERGGHRARFDRLVRSGD